MKKTIMTALLVGTMFTACSVKDTGQMEKEIKKELTKHKAYRDATQNKLANYRTEAYSVSQKEIDVGFYKKPLAKAMREVARVSGVGFDESFIPSYEYQISIEFRGTLGDFLREVKKNTGVSYKYRNGMLKVVNQQLVNKSITEKACKIGEKPTINISLDNVSAMDVFKYFSKHYGFNFTFKTKYYSLGNTAGGIKQPMENTSLFYSGCDPKEAFYSFIKAVDLSAKEVTPNRFSVKDYRMENVDLPTYFDYKYTSGQTLGATDSTTSQSSGSGGSSVSTEERYKREFQDYLKDFMSPDGVLNISNRGYLTIIDRPHKVAEVERIVRNEIAKQAPMDLSVVIMRVTTDDSLETSSNFNASLSKVLGSIDGVPAYIGTGDYAKNMTEGMVAQGTKAGLPQIFKALKQLGDTKVVREYNEKVRNGWLTTFRAVDVIPYVTTSTIASASTTQTSTEAKFANSGIIINMFPQLTENQETINIATDILVSEYLGDKTFNTSDGELSLPQIAENETQAAVQIKMGESAILTGFNLRQSDASRKGVPGAVEQNLYYTERLFGDISKANKASQLVIIVTPKKIKDF